MWMGASPTERVAYRLKKWAGVQVERQYFGSKKMDYRTSLSFARAAREEFVRRRIAGSIVRRCELKTEILSYCDTAGEDDEFEVEKIWSTSSRRRLAERMSVLPWSHAKPGSRQKIASTILRGQLDARAPADRRQVFLTYRELFTGKNVRKSKTIRKILLNHLPDLKESADDAYISNFVSVLKSLLVDRVFQSKEQASEHFPDLFTRPPSEKLTENISKKRKASPGRSINVAQVVQTEAIDKSSPGTTAGISILNSQGNGPFHVTMHSRVDAWVKNMDHNTEVMKQEAERRVRQLELVLQETIAQQQNKISLAAGQGLIESITSELGLHHPNAAAEVKGTLTCDEHAGNTGGITLIDENDIESDENRLQTELITHLSSVMPTARRLPVADVSDTGGTIRPPWFRGRLSREIQFVRFVMRSHPDTAMPIRDLPPPVPMSLKEFPSLDNVLGYPDIWMNDDTGHNEDTTGLGCEYRWRHHWRIWATPYAGHVWVVICHTQSTFRWRDPTALIQPETPAALAVLQHIQQGMSPLSPEPRGRSMQDTCFMLGSASLLSYWGNISQERSVDVWPNASFAVFPIIDSSIRHRFFTVQLDTETGHSNEDGQMSANLLFHPTECFNRQLFQRNDYLTLMENYITALKLVQDWFDRGL
ncbi:ubiquinol-cytochrome-c reductase [Stemphylium lycopersici]|nr:ubiquinol-cytochrome-c reductase [Stemphylium lycopersici]